MGRSKLHKPKRIKTKEIWERSFLGKLIGFATKEEKNFENKHLKAYLKGWERFPFGFTNKVQLGLSSRVPLYHITKQNLVKLEKNEQ